MPTFAQVAANVSTFDMDKTLLQLLQRKDYQAFIIEQNQKRLFEHGTDVEGEDIRTFRAEQGEAYSRFTIDQKLKKGQPDTHVTFKDTGAYYKTFKVEVDNSGFAVSSDDTKPDGKISDNVEVEPSLGLADITELNEKLIPDIQDIIRKALLK